MPELLAHHQQALDVLRFVVLLEGGIVIGLSGFVFRLYWYARTLAAKREKDSGVIAVGVPPRHVALISASHIMLVMAQMVLITEHLGSEFIWYVTPIACVAFSFSIWSLIEVLKFENSRISRYLKPGRHE